MADFDVNENDGMVGFVQNRKENNYQQSNQIMNNPLQLQIVLGIRKANKQLVHKQYAEAIDSYSQCLRTFHENRRYNESVSQNYQHMIHSLRGQAYFFLSQYSEAEKDFDQSISINPHDSVTFGRRAHLYLQMGNISNAIEDIGIALLHEPESQIFLNLLEQLKTSISNIAEQDQQNRLSQLLKECYHEEIKENKQDQDEDEDEGLLNFSRLKKIDRVSTKITSKDIHLRKKDSFVCFKEDSFVEYENIEEDALSQNISNEIAISAKLEEQQKELKKVDEVKIAEESLQINVIRPKSRKSAIKSAKSLFNFSSTSPMKQLEQSLDENEDQISRNIHKNLEQSLVMIDTSQNSIISSLSIKDIDGKILKKGKNSDKIRFSVSRFKEISQNQKVFHNENQLTVSATYGSETKQRKSILRNSHLSISCSIHPPLALKHRNSYGFQNLKEIDMTFFPEISEKVESHVEEEIDSDKDEDSNEHNIFGHFKSEQIKNHLKRMESLPPGLNMTGSLALSKKKSILRRESIVNVNLNATENSTLQKKKSVCFKSTD